MDITRREAVGVQALAYAYGVCAMLTTASSVKIEEGFRTHCPKAPFYQLKTISLFELIDTTTGINQLLLAREERMAIAANIHLQNFTIFRRASLERSSTSASYSYFVIFGMDISFHYFHLAVRFFIMLNNYTPFFYPRQLFLTVILQKILANSLKMVYTYFNSARCVLFSDGVRSVRSH